MKPLRTLLVDDEFLALQLLENYVNQIEDLQLVDKLKSPVQAMTLLQTQPVDLLFLDIQMPGLSGLNLLQSLPRPPITIFTTAYPDYALNAFNLNAVDYLLKPFSFERFLQAVAKARQLMPAATPAAEAAAPPSDREFMTVKVDGKLAKVRIADILFIEGLKEYVRIVCADQRLVTLESLKNLEDTLPARRFLRVHKSYIVAADRVHSIEGNLLHLGPHKIPVSRNKRDEVVAAIFGA
jgi:DNA-binding LytR/AlgR family response regulator